MLNNGAKRANNCLTPVFMRFLRNWAPVGGLKRFWAEMKHFWAELGAFSRNSALVGGVRRV
eukprot:12707832-Alexandrium_andersonii.AAC.1